MDPLGGLTIGRIGLQPILDRDSTQDQHAVLGGLDLAVDLGDQTLVAGSDVTRLQRASKGADQSTAGGSDHVVDGGGVGVSDVGVDARILDVACTVAPTRLD